MVSSSDPERISWERPGDLPGVEILAADNTNRLFSVYHETYTFCVALHGYSEWTYRGRAHVTTRDRVMLFEPGEMHRTTRMRGPATFRVVQLSTNSISEAAAEMGLSRMAPHLSVASVEDDLPLAHALRAFHRALETAATPLERQSRLAVAMQRILERYTEASRGAVAVSAAPRPIERVREYLHAHCVEPVSLAECAGIAGLSRFHMLRAFERQTGLPPHAYQMHLRIARARRLLREGMPAAAAADSLGFADQSHLTRWFRRSLGITPAAYARAGSAPRAISF